MKTLEEYLCDLTHRPGLPGEWRLDRVYQLAEKMHIPLVGNYIHVGGTNGKGSVCAMLAAGFRGLGMKTGCYTSPHLIRWNERIQINGQPISNGDFGAILGETLAQADATTNGGTLSCFEILTIAALAYFSRVSVDIAIIEVGLGGRLDATNIITPRVSAITTIGFDHEEVLGETLEAIASEKAGIAKAGVPLVLGDMPSVAREKILALVPGPVTFAQSDIPMPKLKYLHGVEQEKNGAVALTAAKIYLERMIRESDGKLSVMPHGKISPADLFEKFSSAMTDARWPGRWEKRVIDGRTWIFDCTHNACGLPFLQANWEREHLPAPVVITATLGERRAKALLPYLASIAKRLLLVQLDEPRALSLARLKSHIPSSFSGEIDTVKDLRELPLAGEMGPVLVTGSIYLVGEVLRTINGC
jgi:dihydrofolate synthase/folylpolyglutamate synthase